MLESISSSEGGVCVDFFEGPARGFGFEHAPTLMTVVEALVGGLSDLRLSLLLSRGPSLAVLSVR